MKTLIVVGGLIGLSTAYYLTLRGVKETLVDRGPQPTAARANAAGQGPTALTARDPRRQTYCAGGAQEPLILLWNG